METATKLEKLLIAEVSGVDYPANELDGWLLMKSAAGLEKAIEYADPGLQEDGKKRYPIDTEEHVRAAWGYINQADNKAKYSSEDYTRVRNKIKAAMEKIGAQVADETQKEAVSKCAEQELVEPTGAVAEDAAQAVAIEAESFVGRIKKILAGTSRKEDIDMTKEELNQELDERLAPIGETLKALQASVEKSAETPAETPAAAEVGETQETEVKGVTSEDLTKAVDEAKAEILKAVEPIVEALDKTLDRLAAVETRFATRKSLDGQEAGAGDETPAEPTVGDAIKAAASGRTVELR